MATKTETVAIKVTPQEKQQIKESATARDMTVSKFLYNIIFSSLATKEMQKQ